MLSNVSHGSGAIFQGQNNCLLSDIYDSGEIRLKYHLACLLIVGST